MTKLLERAIAQITMLPEPLQDRIGAELLEHVERLNGLREQIDDGLRSLDAGEGREIDPGDLIRQARVNHGGA